MMRQTMNVLSDDALRAIVPAAYAKVPAAHLSDRYGFIRTADLFPLMAENGLVPVSAKQDNAKRRDPSTVRHEIRFAPMQAKQLRDVGDTIPQVIVINSHNGRTKLQVHAGFFRLVCSNGMVVADKANYAGLVARHTANLPALVAAEQGMTAALEQIGKASDRISQWQQLELSIAQQHAFAKSALQLRFGDGERFKPDDALAVARADDEGDDLWRVFNRVQEHLTRDRLDGTSANGRSIRSRPLSGITLDMSFNAGLWRLADETYSRLM